MNLLFVIGHPGSAAILRGMAKACARQGVDYACFFTGDGVRLLSDESVLESIGGAKKAVVCEYSWGRLNPGVEAPVTIGSQTDHSAMVGEAEHLVSL